MLMWPAAESALRFEPRRALDACLVCRPDALLSQSIRRLHDVGLGVISVGFSLWTSSESRPTACGRAAR